jgi:hypothetical protein
MFGFLALGFNYRKSIHYMVCNGSYLIERTSYMMPPLNNRTDPVRVFKQSFDS